ncbi:MAG: hypothetical protein LBP58_04650 [Azoarcus sp.]|jgi:hypothetical protein|nr:hypothetical protein [Azoarcus sp.]
MRYSLFFALPLCLAMQTALAQQPKLPELCDGCDEIEEDPEPDWDTATYTCPQFIKTVKGEFRFKGYEAFNARYQDEGQLRPMSRKYIQFTFSGAGETDIVCIYEGFNTVLTMPRLKGLIACGGSVKPSLRMACWTTDPYAGKK